MKKVLTILLSFISTSLFSQQLPNSGFDKVRIAEDGKFILAEILPVEKTIHPNSAKFYAWYSADIIHYTQGGFSGRLLNGNYKEFYANKNLKEQGMYTAGLKTGKWKSWKEDGTLISDINWKKGVMAPVNKGIFWNHLPFIHKRKKNIDTLTKKSLKG